MTAAAPDRYRPNMPLTCANCSRENPDHRDFCIYCGDAFASTPRCPKCSRPAKRGVARCMYCGRAMEAAAPAPAAGPAPAAASPKAAAGCPKCSRPVQPHAPRCMYCGHELPRRQTSPGADGLDGRRFEVLCEGCRRTSVWDAATVRKMIRTRQSSCLSCGGRLRMPIELDVMFRAALRGEGAERHPCPGCDRTLSVQPDERGVLSCYYCGMSSMPPAEPGGGARMGPVGQGELATEEAVRQQGSILAMDTLNRVLVGALVGRVRKGELRVDEPGRLLRDKRRMDLWEQPQYPYPFLPLAPDGVAEVLPGLLLGSRDVTIDEGRGHPELVVTLALQQEKTDHAAQALGLLVGNVVGELLKESFGLGFRLGPGDEAIESQVRHRMRVGLHRQDDGTRLTFARQVDNDPPTRLEPPALQALGRELFRRRNLFRAYYAVVAIYGPWARGLTALRVTEPALRKRLAWLGFPEEQAGPVAKALAAALKVDG